jgi:hypothetical protein
VVVGKSPVCTSEATGFSMYRVNPPQWVTHDRDMVHCDVCPNHQILLNEVLSVEEVIEIDERVSHVQVVVGVCAGRLPYRRKTLRRRSYLAELTSESFCLVT